MALFFAMYLRLLATIMRSACRQVPRPPLCAVPALKQSYLVRYFRSLALPLSRLGAIATTALGLDWPDGRGERRIHRFEERLLLLGRRTVGQPFGRRGNSRQYCVGRIAAVGHYGI